MSTHSTISIKEGSKYRGIYCQFDSYLDYNGKILFEHYQNENKIKELIELGDISQLGEKVNPVGKHSYDEPEKLVTVAYHRDRGEEKNPAFILTKSEYEDYKQEYNYVWENGKWTVDGKDLKKELKKNKII